MSRRTTGAFPWGTFVVNISGAFALGLVFTLATERWGARAPWLRSGLTIGFLGAYTTFSTLSFETYRLAEDRAHRPRGREHARHAAPPASSPSTSASCSGGRCDAARGRGQARCGSSSASPTPGTGSRSTRRSSSACARRASPGATVIRGIEGFGAELAPPHLAHPAALRGPAGRDRDRRHRGADRGDAADARRDGRRRGWSRSSPCTSSTYRSSSGLDDAAGSRAARAGTRSARPRARGPSRAPRRRRAPARSRAAGPQWASRQPAISTGPSRLSAASQALQLRNGSSGWTRAPGAVLGDRPRRRRGRPARPRGAHRESRAVRGSANSARYGVWIGAGKRRWKSWSRIAVPPGRTGNAFRQSRSASPSPR